MAGHTHTHTVFCVSVCERVECFSTCIDRLLGSLYLSDPRGQVAARFLRLQTGEWCFRLVGGGRLRGR